MILEAPLSASRKIESLSLKILCSSMKESRGGLGDDRSGTASEKCRIKDFRFHDLRHCFGSWLAMNNVNNKAHMELMGHKDP
jgi:integrase